MQEEEEQEKMQKRTERRVQRKRSCRKGRWRERSAGRERRVKEGAIGGYEEEIRRKSNRRAKA